MEIWIKSPLLMEIISKTVRKERMQSLKLLDSYAKMNLQFKISQGRLRKIKFT